MRAPDRPARREEDGSKRRSRLGRAVAYSLTVFLAARVGLFVLGLVGVALLPNAGNVSGAGEIGLPGPVPVPGWDLGPAGPGWHHVVTAWERFDALWFLRIAEDGYAEGDGSAVFFPLYPLAVRFASFLLGGRPLAAAFLVSNLALLASLVVFYLLAARENSERTARRAVLYLCLFPTAFFLFAPYSESLFLLLSVTAFWAARRGSWGGAALAGALAALTRSVGIVLAPALAVEALHRWRERGGSPLPGLLAAATVPIGTVAYLGFWGSRTGDWLAPLRQQATWQREAVPPWSTVARGTEEAFRWLGTYPGGYHLLDWLIVAVVAGVAVYGIFWLRPGYTVYLWASLVIPLGYAFLPRPFMSMPRFAAVLFPLFLALADATDSGRIPHAAVVATEAAGLGLLTVLFVTWYYVF